MTPTNNAATSNVGLIRSFFATPEKPVTMAEIKELTAEDRVELGDAIRSHQAK